MHQRVGASYGTGPEQSSVALPLSGESAPVNYFKGSENRELLKNEATDLLDNKGSVLDRIRNEATVGRAVDSQQ